MLRGNRYLGKIIGYSLSPIKSSPSRRLDLSRRVGRADIWRQQWGLLETRVYNNPNGCSATGALALGPDHHHQQQQQQLYPFMTTALEGVRGQRHDPASLYPRERPGTHSTGGWLGPKAGLDRCRKSRLHRESICGPTSPWPVALPTLHIHM
jgi:hypothetical protein